MTQVVITVRGLRDVVDRIEEITRRAQDPYEGWKRGMDVLQTGEKRVFATRGAVIGELWPALSAATRRIRGGGARPLVDTGKLLRSLTVQHAAGQVRERRGPFAALFGTDVEYAQYVRERRPMVGAGKRTRTKVVDTMADYLVDG